MMNSPISFGRSIKVAAPIKYAVKLEEMINNPEKFKNNSQVTNKLLEIFTDLKEGKARAFSLDCQNSVILSGKESALADKYGEHLNESVEIINRFYVGDAQDRELFEAHDKYWGRVKSLIDRTQETIAITIGDGKPNPTDEIRHIDIKG